MKILVGKETYAIVDDEDGFRILCEYNLRLRKDGYVVATNRGTKANIRLHRLVIGANDDQVVDHINRTPLDCRKANLRACTQSENMGNSAPHIDKTHTKFKGVYWHKGAKKWMASCSDKYLGLYECETEAAATYDRAAIAKWGEFARTNFQQPFVA